MTAPTTTPLLDCFIPGVPVPKGSMRHVGKGRMIHDNPDLARWMRTILLVAGRLHRGKDPIDAPVAVDVTFWMPPPKRPRWRVPATKPDGDKLARALGDGLERAGVLANDSRITDWHVRKRYADKTHPAGARVTVELVA